MSAIRLPLLCAFAVGCLSSAALLVLWRPELNAGAPPPKQLASNTEVAVASLAAKRVVASDEQTREVSAEPSRAPAPASQGDPPGAGAEAAPPAPAGSAVSDVLMDLETAYRRRLAAAAFAEAAAAPAPAPPNAAIAQAAQAAPAPSVVPVAPPAPPPAPPAPVAVAPAAVALVAAEPPVTAPPVAAEPAMMAQADSRPPDIHIGDVNNTYITNVRQGDVYVMQQQVAMMQYMQLLGASAYGGHAARGGFGASAARGAHGSAPQSQFRQFPSTLTNLDNPWGFNLAPPNLVH